MFSRAAQSLLVALIFAYRATLGHFLGGQCRYYPTCSAYGLDAIREWGPFRGTWMTAWRILRCHPWAKGGLDPVPPNPRSADRARSINEGNKT
jgi:uncharacterized protein